MYHFFVTQDQIGPETIIITGPDVNHMKNVLRMKPGEEILISNGVDKDYRCQVETLDSDAVTARILSVDEEGTELPGKIYLFQGLPKQEKMELIVQKAVELGVYQVIPVAMKRSVVKLDARKEENQDPPLEYHRGERSQAVQTDRDPGSDRGDVGKRGAGLCG